MNKRGPLILILLFLLIVIITIIAIRDERNRITEQDILPRDIEMEHTFKDIVNNQITAIRTKGMENTMNIKRLEIVRLANHTDALIVIGCEQVIEWPFLYEFLQNVYKDIMNYYPFQYKEQSESTTELLLCGEKRCINGYEITYKGIGKIVC